MLFLSGFFVHLILLFVLETNVDAVIVYSDLYNFAYCMCGKCGSTSYASWLWEILEGLYVPCLCVYVYFFKMIV